MSSSAFFFFFFFNDTATTEIYTLSLHDALPICTAAKPVLLGRADVIEGEIYFNGTKYHLERGDVSFTKDRKSTRLNSSHGYISYAVFCLKKKKNKKHKIEKTNKK